MHFWVHVARQYGWRGFFSSMEAVADTLFFFGFLIGITTVILKTQMFVSGCFNRDNRG